MTGLTTDLAWAAKAKVTSAKPSGGSCPQGDMQAVPLLLSQASSLSHLDHGALTVKNPYPRENERRGHAWTGKLQVNRDAPSPVGTRQQTSSSLHQQYILGCQHASCHQAVMTGSPEKLSSMDHPDSSQDLSAESLKTMLGFLSWQS